MFDLARTRTWNPLIRSQMPYPLGHKAGGNFAQHKSRLTIFIPTIRPEKKNIIAY